MKVIIVGGVAGGASAAARLRRLDERAEIVLVERGPYISFANCGLPYYIGGVISSEEELTLNTPESFSGRFNVDVKVNCEVLSLDREKKTLRIRDVMNSLEYEECWDRLILSPGAQPLRPNLPGLDSKKVFTMRDIPDTLAIKEYIERNSVTKAVVIGGGYIGVEMAENLCRAGCGVTIVELAQHILPPFDFDVAAEIQTHLREKGVRLILGKGLEEIIEKDDALTAVLTGGQQIEAELLFLSVGVRPESALAKSCGLEVTSRGLIVTDRHMRTQDESIYAVGDAVQVEHFVTGEPGFLPLAGPANKQGRIAADNICGLNSEYAGTQGTSILKCFDMTAGCTGINERTAKAMGIDYRVSFTWSSSHAGYYPGGDFMSIKLVYAPEDGRLLGAQLAGREGVDKRLDVLATALRAGMTTKDLTGLELAYAPPFSSAKDPVNISGFTAENARSGLVKIIHWHEARALAPEKITWLDVHEKYETSRGMVMSGAINIPLDTLREHMGEISREKPVYVNCHSGMRSYIACRILMQKGFDCYNLAGGWRLFSLCTRELKE
ncbi:MAG: FAD-dependent oxidoreductase [Oscillospiraceae bacterium]|nr:FAD-dependent oxidoreductase [Oscillospiraceae bacterium]